MDLYLNPTTHDLVLDGADLRVTKDDEVLVQRLKIVLQHLYGEWYLDTEKGVPYTQTIFETGANDIDAVYAIFVSEVRNVEGVENLNSLDLSLNRESRELRIALVVNDNVSVEVTI